MGRRKTEKKDEGISSDQDKAAVADAVVPPPTPAEAGNGSGGLRAWLNLSTVRAVFERPPLERTLLVELNQCERMAHVVTPPRNLLIHVIYPHTPCGHCPRRLRLALRVYGPILSWASCWRSSTCTRPSLQCGHSSTRSKESR